MMLKSRIINLFGALVIAGSASAAHQDPDMGACPSVEAIQSEGLTMVQSIYQNGFLTYHQSEYDTDKPWIFVVGIFEAESEDEALDQGNEALVNLSGNPGPTPDDENNTICFYDIDDEHIAVAVTTENGFLSPLKLRSYFQKKIK